VIVGLAKPSQSDQKKLRYARSWTGRLPGIEIMAERRWRSFKRLQTDTRNFIKRVIRLPMWINIFTFEPHAHNVAVKSMTK
jgi:hypothetical protein